MDYTDEIAQVVSINCSVSANPSNDLVFRFQQFVNICLSRRSCLLREYCQNVKSSITWPTMTNHEFITAIKSLYNEDCQNIIDDNRAGVSVSFKKMFHRPTLYTHEFNSISDGPSTTHRS